MASPSSSSNEVLYEIRRHASISFDPIQSPQGSTYSKGGLLSYISLKGVRDKWSWYKRPRSVKRSTSVFVSPNGLFVAVAVRNHIFILHKDDDYKEPCGSFSCADAETIFTHGSWSESKAVLGLVDNQGTLYVIKPTGEEVTCKTSNQLRLEAPIADLALLDDNKSKDSFSCSVCIFAADASILYIEVTREFVNCIKASTTVICHLDKAQLPHEVSCVDLHTELSFAVLVSTSNKSNGTYFLHVVRFSSQSEVQLLSSHESEGTFAYPKVQSLPFTFPKVAISPKGKYVATLDLTGCVDVFEVRDELSSLILISPAAEVGKTLDLTPGKKKFSYSISDFCWWTDNILVLVHRTGQVTMLDILSGLQVSRNNPIFCMPILKSINHHSGHVLILENLSSINNISASGNNESAQHFDTVTSESIWQDTGRSCWRLISLSQISVSEMFKVLIKDKEYQSALDFASQHGLDTDEVLKGQWLHSGQGYREINLYLSQIKDLFFVLSECLSRIGSTEETVRALFSLGLHLTEKHKISDFDNRDDNFIWRFQMFRLQLLQRRDRLETFIGINMGRFSELEYSKFCSIPLHEAAVGLAESGKIGALNLLFKRHPFSISSHVLHILTAIPETIPVQSYCQLLPGKYPPTSIALRDDDWVESDATLNFINKSQNTFDDLDQIMTENILKLSTGFLWPSVAELSDWYTKRALEIDYLSGQLDNCFSLVEFACQNGIEELKHLREDISYLNQLIYDDGFDENFTIRLATWEQLPDYEKFKMMLKGAKEDNIVKRLQDKAIPFIKSCRHPTPVDFMDETLGYTNSANSQHKETFLIKWLKEVSAENQLLICLAVFENQFGDSPIDGLFEDKAVAIETALDCIYLSSSTDQWNTMAAILSKLPRNRVRNYSVDSDRIFTPRHAKQGGFATAKHSYMSYQHEKSTSETSTQGDPSESRAHASYLDSDLYNDSLNKRILITEGHVEVGRLMAFYQVPKPIAFFLSAHTDEKTVKQLIRLILSKFGRRQPSRPDSDWASMWHDIQCFQEKAFPFLDLEYMLTEFIRGLLKAGKFSLARNYLKGTGSIALAEEKAENLVIQAAREYFFSASSLSCSEIWKAKECLSLFPNSENVRAESDVIDALTVRLPNLGVNILPMQFRQIRNPMEIINMVITSQTGAYLNVEELIEIAKLLGLNSQDDISVIEESVAREAAFNGDLQLALDLCLVLARKGHGPIWDLCAAIARGPDLKNMDLNSRKYLLGFSLSHCDDESAGELLNSWKDIDLRNQSEQLLSSFGNISEDLSTEYEQYLQIYSEKDVNSERLKDVLSRVVEDLPNIDGLSWDSILKDNKKTLAFAVQYLPHLFELCVKKEELPVAGEEGPANDLISVRVQALSSIIYWLAGVGIPPSDNLISSLAKSIMEPPVSERDAVLGCAFLLNLVDSFHGAEIIEELLKKREAYDTIMNIGMIYSSLNNAQKECPSPEERRNMLMRNFHDKHISLSEDAEKMSQPTFWREWKIKLEEQKRLADQARQLEQIMPGIEASRFLSGETEYIKTVVFSFIDSVMFEKRHILKQAVVLADTYGLQRIEVLLKFLGCALSSEHWSNDDILSEILEFRDDIVRSAKGVIDMIFSVVYPQIDGQNKERLSYVYSILSACFLHLQRNEDPALMEYIEEGHTHILEPNQYYKVLDQECRRVSFIKKLNFKNIAGLDDLNFEHFNEEVCNNIHSDTVEALSSMVHSLVSIYNDSQAKGLISMKGVYKHHVLGLLAFLEGRNEARSNSINADELLILIKEIEQTFDSCNKYIRVLSAPDIAYVTGKYCSLCFPCNFSRNGLQESEWKECLLALLTFWIKVIDDIPEKISCETPIEKSFFHLEKADIRRCLHVFRRLLMEDEISVNQGWGSISNYVKLGLVDGLSNDVSSFLTSMIFSSCPFESIAETCYGELPLENFDPIGCYVNLPQLYLHLTDVLLSEVSQESSGQQNFHNLLSSLSKPAVNFREELKAIRSEVWEKLSAFSQDSDVSSYTRMHTLQLMQSITGNAHKHVTAEFDSEVKPWEEWNESSCAVTTKNAEGADIPSSISTNLVALRSTQLLSAILPSFKVDSEQLMTLDSAVSCFLDLCERVTSVENINVLRTVLEVWGELFSNKTDKVKKIESPKESNWSSDEWDEGWEALPEELVETTTKQEGPASVCALHACWMEIIRRLVGFSRSDLLLELLDQSSSKSEVLLDEDETQSLFHLVVEKDCFLAFKILMLLPYPAPRSQCLSVVESRLKDGVSTASHVADYELLVLLLSSGTMIKIASDASYSKVFAYACYSVGLLARAYQESLLKYWEGDKSEIGQISIFASVLLPYFICELVGGGQPLLAGCIIFQCMHTHPSLGVLDVTEATLIRYLEVQVNQLQLTAVDGRDLSANEPSESVAYSISCLKSQLESKLKSSVMQLSKSLTRPV